MPRDTVRHTSLQELWSVAEETAAKHGKTVQRDHWHLVVGCHLAESRREAFEDIRVGDARVLTQYFDQTLGNEIPKVPANQIVDFMVDHNQWIVGTPDNCIAAIERLQDISGEFGGFMVMVQDWAPREKVLHSYELLARYVMPHFQGTLTGLVASRDRANERREVMQAGRLSGLQRATEAYFGARRTEPSRQVYSGV